MPSVYPQGNFRRESLLEKLRESSAPLALLPIPLARIVTLGDCRISSCPPLTKKLQEVRSHWCHGAFFPPFFLTLLLLCGRSRATLAFYSGVCVNLICVEWLWSLVHKIWWMVISWCFAQCQCLENSWHFLFPAMVFLLLTASPLEM